MTDQSNCPFVRAAMNSSGGERVKMHLYYWSLPVGPTPKLFPQTSFDNSPYQKVNLCHKFYISNFIYSFFAISMLYSALACMRCRQMDGEEQKCTNVISQSRRSGTGGEVVGFLVLERAV